MNLLIPLITILLVILIILVVNKKINGFLNKKETFETEENKIIYFNKKENTRPHPANTTVLYTNVNQIDLDLIKDKLEVYNETNMPPFYRFDNRLASININTTKSLKSTLSFYFILDYDEERLKTLLGRTQVLASSNYWSIIYKNGFISLVFNGKVIKSFVKIELRELYNIVFVFNQETKKIKLYVNGNLSYEDIDNLGDFQTETIKFGSDKFNENRYIGLIGGITYLDNNEYSRDDICALFKNCKLESTKCLFTASGTDITDCVKKCSGYCRPKECMNKCLECNDNVKCKWVTKPKEEDIDVNINIPKAPKIRVIPGDKKVFIDFKKPKDIDDNDVQIDEYIIYVQESFNKMSGVRIIVMDKANCDVCEHIVTNLKNEVYYNIAVKSKNDAGTSEISNIEVVAPNGPISNKQISDTLIETNNELMEGITKDLDEEMCQLNIYSTNRGHALSKIRKNFTEEIKEIFGDKNNKE